MNCRICSSSNLKKIVRLSRVPASAQLFLESKEINKNCSINLEIKQCTNCGHVQSTNDPVEYYREVITAAGLSETICEERISVINQIINDNNLNNPQILEIGSHQGLMVKTIRDNIKCDVIGIEASKKSVQIAQENNINVVEGYFGENSQNLENKKFDIVVCYNFLEHMPNPTKVLEFLKKYLKETAFIYMTVPSLNFIKNTSCIHEFISDHLSYFTLNSLKRLFSFCGFEVIKCNSFHNNNDLEIIAKYEKIEELCLELSRYYQLIKDLNNILSSIPNEEKPIFIWGAGHRSLTLISQLDYEKINFIVDSAKFKQKLFSPVSRLKIVSPSFLKNFNNGTLILNLPGIYGEEVISSLDKTIKSKYNIFNIVENNIFKIK